jgi:hypothetical protein
MASGILPGTGQCCRGTAATIMDRRRERETVHAEVMPANGSDFPFVFHSSNFHYLNPPFEIAPCGCVPRNKLHHND